MEPLRIHRGFSLIELMVVLAIILVITSVVLSNQSSFNKTVILANTAYDIGLTLRSAQTYGLGSRTLGTATNVGYGVHLSSGTPYSFGLFADTSPGASCSTPDCKPGDHIYTLGSDVLVQTYTLGNRISINDFCSYSNSVWSCASSGGLTSLDIVFARPNPTPYISPNGTYSTTFPATTACISVTSPQGGARFTSVTASGQINAAATSCP